MPKTCKFYLLIIFVFCQINVYASNEIQVGFLIHFINQLQSLLYVGMVWTLWNMQNPNQISTNALLLPTNRTTNRSSLYIEKSPTLSDITIDKLSRIRFRRFANQAHPSDNPIRNNLYSSSKYDCPTTMFSIHKSSTDSSSFRSQIHHSNLNTYIVYNRTNPLYPIASKDRYLKPDLDALLSPETKGQSKQPCFDPFQAVYITATRGSNVMIPCKVHNIDFSSTVMSWWREDSPVQLTVGNEISSPRFTLDKSDPLSWTLVINRVTDVDSGTYICQINLAHLKEKFFHLNVIPPKLIPDTTKLNDEYVKDEAVKIVAMNSGPNHHQQQQIKSLQILNTPGPSHTLTCYARFDQRNPESTIQWIHDRSISNTRQFGQLNKYSDTDRKLFKSGDSDIDVPQNGLSIQTRWLNKTTLSSVLRLGPLSSKNAGVWTCRKIPGTLTEFIEETSVTLNPDNTDLLKFYQSQAERSHRKKNSVTQNRLSVPMMVVFTFLLIWLIK